MKASEVPVPCACTTVRRGARVLARTYDASLARSGMNVTQLAVMRAILRHPNEPLTRAADDLAMDRTSLYRALASLQRKNWVKLKEAGDARSHSASVTEAGHVVLTKADAAWARTQTGIVNCFGYPRWKAFVLELQRLIECANTVAANQSVVGAKL